MKPEESAKKVKRERRKRIRLIVTAALILSVVITLATVQYFLPFSHFLPAYSVPARAEGELRLHFISVGQADCTAIEFPEGDVLLVDGGDGSWESRNHLVRYIKGIQPKSISYLVTHADSDHYGGVAALISLFGAERVYLPEIGSDGQGYTQLVSAAERAGCSIERLTRYSVISRPSGAYTVCLSPYSVGETDGNDASTVLWLTYRGVSALLSGDISAKREQILMQEYALDEGIFDAAGYPVRLNGTDILKTAHHGSDGSSSAEWISLLQPKVAVISCGTGNAYSHPSGGAVTRIREAAPQCEIYRTDEAGDVLVSILDGYNVLTDYCG